ncbi:MAG: DNA primase small subunit PriS [Thermoplasmata archaeon]
MDSKTKTRRFLHGMLKSYYTKTDLELPPRFTLREFAFIYRGSRGMHRPVAFVTGQEFKEFMAAKLPIHTYYSTAYYSNPRAPMKNKEWLGADLIFDLDSDHLPGGENMSYPRQLELVKKKTRLLLEDFLMDDFGFQEKHIKLVFSGNRGYHIHVRKKEVFSLPRSARREIVDYITGTGISLSSIFPYDMVEVSKFKEFSKTEYSYKFPPRKKGGWGRRAIDLIKYALERWSHMSKEEFVEEVAYDSSKKTGIKGIGEKTAVGLYNELYGQGKWRDIIKKETLDDLSESGMVNQKYFLKIFEQVIRDHGINQLSLKFVGATDEPVTGDTKRLIRLPTSIHGGSFLVVKPIDIAKFDDFEPLKDAFIEISGDKNYDIRLEDLPNEEYVVLKGKTYEFEKNMNVPECLVPFFVTKYQAKVL